MFTLLFIDSSGFDEMLAKGVPLIVLNHKWRACTLSYNNHFVREHFLCFLPSFYKRGPRTDCKK